MSQLCRFCGHPGASTGRCVRCGARLEGSPLENQVVGAPPGAAVAVPKAPQLPSSRVAEGDQAPARSGRRLRLPLTIAIVASVVMALATGAAFALPYLGALLPQGLRPEEPRHELVVKGTASARSAWRNGYLERWRVNPAQRIEAVQPDSGASDAGYGGRNGEVIALTADIATASGAVLAVTASDGETKWVAGSGETCAGLVEGDRLRCQGGRMGYYPTDLVELSTGEGRLIASSQELGARIPDGQEDSYGWSTYAVEGVLLASWTTEDDAEEPQHGNVARINAAGTGFSWRSEYSWDGVDVTGRIHHGMLNDRSFAVNVENGDLMVDVRSRGGRGPVQWVAEDVIQDGSDSSVATPLVAPDGKAVTRIGRGAVPITSQGLPKHPLRYERFGNRDRLGQPLGPDDHQGGGLAVADRGGRTGRSCIRDLPWGRPSGRHRPADTPRLTPHPHR